MVTQTEEIPPAAKAVLESVQEGWTLRTFMVFLLAWTIGFTILFALLGTGAGYYLSYSSCEWQVTPRTAQRQFLKAESSLSSSRAASNRQMARLVTRFPGATTPGLRRAWRRIWMTRARNERKVADFERRLEASLRVPHCTSFPPPVD